MKVFIDCGSNEGAQLLKFKESSFYDNTFFMYAFEPNPLLAANLKKMGIAYVFQAAVWTADGAIPFYINNKYNDTSTIYADKLTGRDGRTSPSIVESIDFSKWIEETFSHNDTLHVSMDIEGAEYPVLEKMIEQGTLSYINYLAVEFHQTKIPSISKERHNNLVAKLNRYIKNFTVEHS